MTTQSNIGQAFPLESLGSDLARNSFNYQSILNALIEWNSSTEDTVMVRLTKDTSPWYEDFEIPTKQSVFSANTYMSDQKGILDPKLFAVSSLMNIATYGGTPGNTDDPGDILTLRLSVKDSGSVSWGAYYAPIVTEWVSGISIRQNNLFNYGGMVYKALNTMSTSLVPPSSDLVNYKPYFKEWVQGTHYYYGDYVSRSGSLYKAIVEISNSQVNPSIAQEFEVVASAWDVSTEYKAGSYVMVGNYLYLAKSDNMGSNPTDPVQGNWKKVILYLFPTLPSFNASVVVRWFTDVDISMIIFKNITTLRSTPQTEFYVQNSVKTKGNPSIYQKSTAVISTSNYAMFPADKTGVWSEAAPIASTDDSLDITKRQAYSASMVFDHANQNDAKTINFINYDGPDLDQGLCIYLPVESEISGGQIVVPEDGFTYEFYLRIWPNTKLTTDTITRDHIVNKAQVYVYSAADADSIAKNKCSYPIAKFSMSRMTNFYIFAENVTIPDKPVVYRATFIFSAVQNGWTLYDYYQMPDHVFVGPVGFIDPQNPAHPDYNSPELSNINPSAAHIGYETCALPTYVDVFSNPDLSPYKSSDGSFFNRSI